MIVTGNRARRLAAAVVLLGLSCAAQSAPPPPATPFAIHDFTPEFWKFWNAAQGQPVERQAQLWQQQYVSQHQAVFDELATPCKDQWDPVWSRTNYFTDLPRKVPAIRALVAGLTEQLAKANGRFLKTFPDMRWSGDVYVMASGYCFNGRAQTIQGRSALLFGVDAMAALDQKDLLPTMQHELFHRYHHEFFDYEVQRAYPLWTALWAEGLATYVSEQLNPSASEVDLAMVPLGMVRQVNERRAELAADFLRRFESTADKDANLFFNDANSKDPVIPGRAGYQLGVLVATELSKQNSMQTMAHWTQAQANPKVREALERIAATSPVASSRERELDIRSGGVRIAGTLVMPQDRPQAAIVLVPWAGKVERALPLARQFADRGIAVYTYDKRGVGRSEGEHGVGTQREQLEAGGADAAAALTAVATEPALKATPLGFFGISQAGWVTPYAATKSRPAFMALWSAPVCTFREELHFSAVAEHDPAYLATHSSEQIRAYMKTMPHDADDFDPGPYLKQLTIPGLWIFGGRDSSIPLELSMQRLAGLIENGRGNFEYRYYPDQAHSLTDDDRDGFTHVVEWIVRQAANAKTPDERR